MIGNVIDAMTLNDEYQAALAEYRAAQAQFDDAVERDRVDEAVYRLQAAELRVSAALRALRQQRAAG